MKVRYYYWGRGSTVISMVEIAAAAALLLEKDDYSFLVCK
jgi:hypothetical protein